MSEQKDFYMGSEAGPLYRDIASTYQRAFAEDPWYEVSKCADEQLRCVGGLSGVAIGALCGVCENRPSRPAYETAELLERFEALAATRPTAWYTEQTEAGLTLAAAAWRAPASVIAAEKYADVPQMATWLDQMFGDNDVVWLDEVFANKSRKQKGNLQNFGAFVKGLAGRLNSNIVAYRTISPQMLGAAVRDFGQDALIFAGQRNRTSVDTLPVMGSVSDRRDLIIINVEQENIS